MMWTPAPRSFLFFTTALVAATALGARCTTPDVPTGEPDCAPENDRPTLETCFASAANPLDEGGDLPGAGVSDGRSLGSWGAFLKLTLTVFTLQDAILLTYMLLVGCLLGRIESGAKLASCEHENYACIVVVVLGCFVARAPTGISAGLRSAVYRSALLTTLLWNYVMLRDVLPLIRPGSVDVALLHLDLDLFGVEPSLYLERLNRRPIVEWFSFFYFSYYGLCVGYAATVVWLSRLGRATTEFALGTLFVFCVGEVGYMLVPGYGPIRALDGQFHGPIQGGLFWGCVWQTVQAGSAMKDIFPSLHTAVPLWFALFALHQSRRDRRYLPAALATAFFSANIVFSTMFLRWHYAVDVLAGVVLASVAALLAPRLAAREAGWRLRWGLPDVWSFSH